MPFYTKRMVRYLEGKDGKKKRSGKDKGSGKGLRVAPSGISGAAGAKAGTTAVPQTEVLTTAPVETVPDKSFDEKKLLFMKGLLKASVERLNHEKGALPTKHRYFGRYTINMEEPPFAESPLWKLFKGKHQDFADSVLAVKLSEGEHGLTADSLQLKILKVLGKKHPNIIQTWDVFHNPDNNQIIIFQEMANRGSLDKYLEQNQCDEPQAGKWLSQILKGLDYLGDVGISHRSLQPKHILLTHKDLRVKIGGFEMATVYWDPTKEDIKNATCLPLDTRPTDKPSYQAPEVYGDPSKEEYDPLVADVWSLGATFYFMLSKQYPYDFASADPNAVSQIQQNVDQIQGLSVEGKKLMAEMLKPMAVERRHIDKLQTDPWLKPFK